MVRLSLPKGNAQQGPLPGNDIADREMESAKEIRDKVTNSYTTIALVSALLAAVSFAAYSTPPSELFSSAAASPPPAPGAAASPPPQQLHGWAEAGKIWNAIPWATIYNFTISALWHIYGVVMPVAFIFNLAGTLSAAGVILYANSTMATNHALNKLFGDRESEHSVMKFPAAFLVFGVVFLFAGFAIGIALFYGLLVGFFLGFGIFLTIWLYEACFAQQSHGDSFTDLLWGLSALFFRSCSQTIARKADEIYAKGVQEEQQALLSEQGGLGDGGAGYGAGGGPQQWQQYGTTQVLVERPPPVDPSWGGAQGGRQPGRGDTRQSQQQQQQKRGGGRGGCFGC